MGYWTAKDTLVQSHESMAAAQTPVPKPEDPKAPHSRSSWTSSILVSAVLAVGGSFAYYITRTFAALFDSMSLNLPWATSIIVLNYRWLYPGMVVGAVLVLIGKQFFVRSEGRRMAVTICVAALVVVFWWSFILALYAQLNHLADQLR